MEKFRIDFNYEMCGSVEIEANTIEEAMTKLEDDLSYYGLEDLPNKKTLEHNHREWNVE